MVAESAPLRGDACPFAAAGGVCSFAAARRICSARIWLRNRVALTIPYPRGTNKRPRGTSGANRYNAIRVAACIAPWRA